MKKSDLPIFSAASQPSCCLFPLYGFQMCCQVWPDRYLRHSHVILKLRCYAFAMLGDEHWHQRVMDSFRSCKDALTLLKPLNDCGR